MTDDPNRRDLEDGLRFVHLMGMQPPAGTGSPADGSP
jgi:hypothetical protein